MGFLKKFLKIYFWVWFIWPFIKNGINHFKVMGAVDTMRWVKEHRSSLIRFGDGEFSYMRGNKYGPPYQPYSDELKKCLNEILTVRNNEILLAVPRIIQQTHLKGLTRRAQNHWKAFLSVNYRYIKNNLDDEYLYGDGQVSRPYMDTKNTTICEQVFGLFKEITQNRKVVVIEGEKTRLGVGNDLLEKALTVQRVICPAKNSFSYVDDILEKVFSLYPEADPELLFIVALGPAAKPIVLNLALKGNQALDLGHFDIEYEWFISGAEKKTKVEGKAMYEAKAPIVLARATDLSEYVSQIQAKILENRE